MTTPSRSADRPLARVPKGTTTGGRFTVATRVEPQLALAGRSRNPGTAPTRDKYGFPVVVCPRCQGRGTHGHNTVDGERCYGCGGTGHTYAPEVLRDVVAEFAAAQRAAARPKVRDLKPGDVISKPYTQLEQAQFRTVVRVLVAPQKPTRFEGRGKAKRPAAFAAAIDYADGTRDVVTTDFVYARRGANVDPEPFVARATGSVRGARPARRTA